MQMRLQDLVELVERARRAGARGAEVLLVEGQGHEVEVCRGKVVKDEPTREERLVVRCWVEGGGGGQLATTADRADEAIEIALAEAREAPQDPRTGPIGRLPQAPGGLGIDDRRYAQVSHADRLDLLVAAERGARVSDRRVRPEPFTYRDSRTHRAFANSRGVVAESWSTLYVARGAVLGADDHGSVRLEERLAGRAFSTVASFPFGAGLARRALELLGRPQSVEGPVRCVLPPRVVALLLERLTPAFVGEPGFLQDRALHPQIHLVDDGTVPGALRTAPFDDRGVPPVPIALIREGRLHARLLAPAGARAGELHPTGHWHGGRLRPNNLLMRVGTRSVNAILAELDDRVVVLDHVQELTLDLATGQVAMLGYGQLTEGGSVVGPVRDLPLRGDLAEVLTRVVEVASDTDRLGHIDAPALVVDGLVAGLDGAISPRG